MKNSIIIMKLLLCLIGIVNLCYVTSSVTRDIPTGVSNSDDYELTRAQDKNNKPSNSQVPHRKPDEDQKQLLHKFHELIKNEAYKDAEETWIRYHELKAYKDAEETTTLAEKLSCNLTQSKPVRVKTKWNRLKKEMGALKTEWDCDNQEKKRFQAKWTGFIKETKKQLQTERDDREKAEANFQELRDKIQAEANKPRKLTEREQEAKAKSRRKKQQQAPADARSRSMSDKSDASDKSDMSDKSVTQETDANASKQKQQQAQAEARSRSKSDKSDKTDKSDKSDKNIKQEAEAKSRNTKQNQEAKAESKSKKQEAEAKPEANPEAEEKPKADHTTTKDWQLKIIRECIGFLVFIWMCSFIFDSIYGPETSDNCKAPGERANFARMRPSKTKEKVHLTEEEEEFYQDLGDEEFYKQQRKEDLKLEEEHAEEEKEQRRNAGLEEEVDLEIRSSLDFCQMHMGNRKKEAENKETSDKDKTRRGRSELHKQRKTTNCTNFQTQTKKLKAKINANQEKPKVDAQRKVCENSKQTVLELVSDRKLISCKNVVLIVIALLMISTMHDIGQYFQGEAIVIRDSSLSLNSQIKASEQEHTTSNLPKEVTKFQDVTQLQTPALLDTKLPTDEENYDTSDSDEVPKQKAQADKAKWVLYSAASSHIVSDKRELAESTPLTLSATLFATPAPPPSPNKFMGAFLLLFCLFGIFSFLIFCCYVVSHYGLVTWQLPFPALLTSVRTAVGATVGLGKLHLLSNSKHRKLPVGNILIATVILLSTAVCAEGSVQLFDSPNSSRFCAAAKGMAPNAAPEQGHTGSSSPNMGTNVYDCAQPQTQAVLDTNLPIKKNSKQPTRKLQPTAAGKKTAIRAKIDKEFAGHASPDNSDLLYCSALDDWPGQQWSRSSLRLCNYSARGCVEILVSVATEQLQLMFRVDFPPTVIRPVFNSTGVRPELEAISDSWKGGALNYNHCCFWLSQLSALLACLFPLVHRVSTAQLNSETKNKQDPHWQVS